MPDRPTNDNAKMKGVQNYGLFQSQGLFPDSSGVDSLRMHITWDDYSIMKNHGDYVQLLFPSSAAKGHDTYDLYLNDSGRMTKAYGHPGNAGFEGWKYY